MVLVDLPGSANKDGLFINNCSHIQLKTFQEDLGMRTKERYRFKTSGKSETVYVKRDSMFMKEGKNQKNVHIERLYMHEMSKIRKNLHV